jgi:hypothetical protein
MIKDAELKTNLPVTEQPDTVTYTTPASLDRWVGSVTWPHPDEWGIDEWEAWRACIRDAVDKRTGKTTDSISEQFCIAVSFTSMMGTADFNGVNLKEWAVDPSKRKYRFVNWFYQRWYTDYMSQIVDPKE